MNAREIIRGREEEPQIMRCGPLSRLRCEIVRRVTDGLPGGRETARTVFVPGMKREMRDESEECLIAEGNRRDQRRCAETKDAKEETVVDESEKIIRA